MSDSDLNDDIADLDTRPVAEDGGFGATGDASAREPGEPAATGTVDPADEGFNQE